MTVNVLLRYIKIYGCTCPFVNRSYTHETLCTAINDCILISIWKYDLTSWVCLLMLRQLRNNYSHQFIKLHIWQVYNFYPRPVLASGYCRCLCLCVCVYQSLACPDDNSSPVQARITKFGPEKQNTLVKFPIVLGGNWPWPSRSNLTSNLKLTPFWACPNHYSPPILVRISKLRQQMHFSTVKMPVNAGLDWPWTSPSFLIRKLFFFILAVCIETVKQSLVCFNAVQGLFHSLYTSAHGERTVKVEWGLWCCCA